MKHLESMAKVLVQIENVRQEINQQERSTKDLYQRLKDLHKRLGVMVNMPYDDHTDDAIKCRAIMKIGNEYIIKLTQEAADAE